MKTAKLMKRMLTAALSFAMLAGTVTVNAQTGNASQASSRAKRTVMVYMVASTLEYDKSTDNLKGFGTDDLLEMQEADVPDDVNVVVECGGTEQWKHPDIPDGTVSRQQLVDHEWEQQEDLGKVPITTEGSLSDFISWSVKNYPAEEYVLVLWDHGGGSPISFGMDELSDEGDGYSDIELGQELQTAGIHFESVVMNACLMGSLEIAEAVQDYADFLVAAESTVYVPDIDYTNWLAELDEADEDYIETIVEDYQKTVEDYGLTSSMSAIRLDRIDAVYDAYLDYVRTVAEDFDENYTEYMKIRSECGTYEGTDSVDLMTLATKYQTDASSALINSITNATVYTYSSISYGHGITVCSPFIQVDSSVDITADSIEESQMYNYESVRKSFTKLGYDQDIIDFYDSVVSYLYQAYYPNYVQRHAASLPWFQSKWADLVEENQSASDEIKTLNTVQNEETEEYYIPSSNEYMDKFNSIKLSCYLRIDNEEEDDSFYVLLGKMSKKITDDNGNLVLRAPKMWIRLNGMICNVHEIMYIENDDDSFAAKYYLAVTVNDQEAYLYVEYDSETGEFTPMYYYLADIAEGTILNEADGPLELKSDDTIAPVWVFGETDEYEISTETMPDYETTADKMVIQWSKTYGDDSNAEDDTWYGCYDITDVYGNCYNTNVCPMHYKAD